MTVFKPSRILDPVHGLIQFDDTALHRLLIRLIDSRVFQRLRGIRQLGLGELVYPGATHVRFSHSIGVAHLVQRMLERIDCSEISETSLAPSEQESLILAALLHDIGHGPYSHVFERVENDQQDHVTLAEMLLQSGEIREIFTEFDRCATLERLPDLWRGRGRGGEIISGTLDADRLDYLHRDQVMTGSFQGRFDWPWLLDNIAWDAGGRGGLVVDHRAIHALEEYLLARSHLYQTVYFHRTVRGAEMLLIRLLRHFRALCLSGEIDAVLSLPTTWALKRWYQKPPAQREITDFLRLDDSHIQTLLSWCTESKDTVLADYARRLRYRKLYHCFEATATQQEVWLARLSDATSRQAFEEETGIMPESVSFAAYDSRQPILVRQDGVSVALSEVSGVARALSVPVQMLRFYYEDDAQLRRVGLRL